MASTITIFHKNARETATEESYLALVMLFGIVPHTNRALSSLFRRKMYLGDRLRGPGLGCLQWALALEEGWEARYTSILESGDGWAAMHLLR